jgi:VWFA-related protein
MRKFLAGGFSAAFLVALLGTVPVQARPQSDTAGTIPVTTVVTALGSKFTAPPALSKDDVTLREGNVRRDITNWIPAQGDRAGLQLAIVIDDSLQKTFGNQLQALSSFITSQPKSTSVGVFYAANGTLQVASQFNPDSEAVAKTLRLPTGTYGAASSIYQSLLQLIGGWPVTGARREVLLFSDGFDYLRKERFSPDLQLTIDKAQRAGILIHAIYESTAGRPGRNRRVANIGQGNLNQLSDGTGGYAFFSGDRSPLSINPYLSRVGMALKNQYFLTFATTPSKNGGKGEYRSIKVVTERRDVELKAPDKVFVPGTEK